MRKLWIVGALFVVLAGCSSGSKAASVSSPAAGSATTSTAGPTGAPTSPFATTPPPSPSMGSTVNAVRLPGNEGLALAGPNGHTLYLFDNNHGTTSACAAACQQVWPPLVASATPTAGPGLDTAELTTGPSGQVMYNNNLLFDYSGDKAPGDANGFGIPGWHIVSPRGTGMTTK